MVDVIKFDNQDQSDVVLVVAHRKALKVSVRPTRVMVDEEIYTEEIGRKVGKLAKCAVVINDTLSDPNKPDDFFEFDKQNKQEFFDAISSLNPKLVIDIHGCAPVGPLFMNPTHSGYRYFRYFNEKPQLGPRPDVDIEYKRKHGFATCKGAIVVPLAEIIAKAGFIVDFEAVFPGGNVIQQTSSFKTDAFALEINKKVREDDEQRERLIIALANFIKLYKDGIYEEVISEDIYSDTNEMLEDFEKQYNRMKNRATGKPPVKGNLTYIG